MGTLNFLETAVILTPHTWNVSKKSTNDHIVFWYSSRNFFRWILWLSVLCNLAILIKSWILKNGFSCWLITSCIWFLMINTDWSDFSTAKIINRLGPPDFGPTGDMRFARRVWLWERAAYRGHAKTPTRRVPIEATYSIWPPVGNLGGACHATCPGQVVPATNPYPPPPAFEKPFEENRSIIEIPITGLGECQLPPRWLWTDVYTTLDGLTP